MSHVEAGSSKGRVERQRLIWVGLTACFQNAGRNLGRGTTAMGIRIVAVPLILSFPRFFPESAGEPYPSRHFRAAHPCFCPARRL